MGHLGLNMGKVIRVRKKLVGSPVFLKLVRPLVFSDPACVDNRVRALVFKLNQTTCTLRSFASAFVDEVDSQKKLTRLVQKSISSDGFRFW